MEAVAVRTLVEPSLLGNLNQMKREQTHVIDSRGLSYWQRLCNNGLKSSGFGLSRENETTHRVMLGCLCQDFICSELVILAAQREPYEESNKVTLTAGKH
jgi:hypothetical protein